MAEDSNFDQPLHQPQLLLTPIGQLLCDHVDKHSAPRQPAASQGHQGRIVLNPGAELEHALCDLEQFSHIWVVFWFHLDSAFRPKVTPPRSPVRRGVLATRSPHRPNPIGLSLLRLRCITGNVLQVTDVDLLNGTPVLDIKPYLPYTDVAAGASHGWLERPADPGPVFEVRFEPRAETQLGFLESQGVGFLRTRAMEALSLGPTPHPYRRIRQHGDHFQIAIKDFRIEFTVAGTTILIAGIRSGYKARVLRNLSAQPKADTPLDVHRRFVATFGER